METLYDILEVSQKASKEVIEKAYRTLVKRYHPDLQAPENKASAEEKMKQINEAYNILSDDEKRREYDMQLESEERQKEEQKNRAKEYNAYYNTNYVRKEQTTPNNAYVNNAQSYYTYNTEQVDDDWKTAYANLNKKQQKKIMKKIQKEANSEYRKLYEDYFRSLGYVVKHKWTLKDVAAIAILIWILITILGVLWIIPKTHEMLINLYNDNIVVKIIVDLFVGICKGIITFFKNLIKS